MSPRSRGSPRGGTFYPYPGHDFLRWENQLSFAAVAEEYPW